MTQKELVLSYIREFGSIIPAKMSGRVFKGIMFGSESSKRAREMRKLGILNSRKEGKFERFFIKPKITLPPARVERSKQMTLV